MKFGSEGSEKLYNYMIKKGYPENFAKQIAINMNSDWTSGRMIGYLRNNGNLSPVDIADEMVAILEDRKRLIEKHENERANAAWNEFLNSDYRKNSDE